MKGVGLGWRLVLRAHGPARARVILGISGFALASLALAVLLALITAGHAANQRTLAQQPVFTSDHGSFRVRSVTLPFRQRPWTTTTVTQVAPDAPVPPGLSAFPGPGEVWVSPTLKSLLHTDPSLQARLPGTVVGVIGNHGLNAPNQVLAVVGRSPAASDVSRIAGADRDAASFAGGSLASGWGTPRDLGDGESLLPVPALLLTAGGLIGIPLVFFALTVQRLSSQARRRRTAALVLLGTPRSVLARAAGTEAALLAGGGALLGQLLALPLVPALATSGLAGPRWFARDTQPSTVHVLVVTCVFAGAAWQMAARSIRTSSADAVRNRHDPSSLTTTRGLIAFVVGLGVLAGFIAIGILRPGTALATGPLSLAFLVALAASVGGGLLIISQFTVRLADHVHRRWRSVAGLLAVRRLQADASSAARMSGGILLLLVTALLGRAVVVDLASLVQVPADGIVVQVQLGRSLTAAQAGAAIVAGEQHSAVTALRFRMDGQASDQNPSVQTDLAVLTCASLTAWLGPPSDRSGEPCRDGRTYRIGQEPEPLTTLTPALAPLLPATDVTDVNIPGLFGSDLDGVAYLVTEAPDRWAAAPNPTLIARPGPGNGPPEDFTTAILDHAPDALIDYDGVDITAVYRVPLITRLIQFSTLTGLLIALATFLIAATDRNRERRRDVAALTAIGTSRGLFQRAEAGQVMMAAAAAGILGTGIGWAGADAYLAMGGHHGLYIAGLVQAAALLATCTLTTALFAPLLAPRRFDPQELRRQ